MSTELNVVAFKSKRGARRERMRELERRIDQILLEFSQQNSQLKALHAEHAQLAMLEYSDDQRRPAAPIPQAQQFT
jgi:hypothetical protein